MRNEATRVVRVADLPKIPQTAAPGAPRSGTSAFAAAVLSGELYAYITQVGRFTYSINLHHGMSSRHLGIRIGRRRAERVATRALARYRLDQARRDRVWIVS